MPFFGVVHVEGCVEDFVQRVVARRDEAGRREADEDPDREVPPVHTRDGAECDDDSRQDEDVLEPVVRARDFDVGAPVERTASGGFACSVLGGGSHGRPMAIRSTFDAPRIASKSLLTISSSVGES